MGRYRKYRRDYEEKNCEEEEGLFHRYACHSIGIQFFGLGEMKGSHLPLRTSSCDIQSRSGFTRKREAAKLKNSLFRPRCSSRMQGHCLTAGARPSTMTREPRRISGRGGSEPVRRGDGDGVDDTSGNCIADLLQLSEAITTCIAFQ